jgi:hypothetical protein
MKGKFASKSELDNFVNPLKNFGLIMGENGIVLNITVEDDTVGAKINAINNSVGTVIKSDYKELFKDFTVDSDDGCKIGILRIGEFVNLFSLFDDGEVVFEFDEETKELKLSQGKSKIIYQTADPDLIKEFNKPFSGSNWFASFDYDDKFTKFTKAMSVLSNEECIIVEGDQTANTVRATIRNKSVAVNSYQVELDTTVSEDFNIPYKKEIMQMVLSPKHESVKLSFGDRVCMVETEDKFNSTVYYISKMIKSS